MPIQKTIVINNAKATVFEVNKSKTLCKELTGRVKQIEYINNNELVELKINGTERKIKSFLSKLTGNINLINTNSYADGKAFNNIYTIINN